MKHKKLLLTLTTGAAIALFPGQAAGLDFKNTDKVNLVSKEKPEAPRPKPKPAKKAAPKPKPIFYVIRKGDSLTKIAKAKHTSVKRLWSRNLHVKHPDQIKPGQKIIIPQAAEKLRDRPFPAISIDVPVQSVRPLIAPQNGSNTYDYGYCTWYVKNRKPSLPNNLGNADTWFARAQAQGMAVGYSPRAGAAAQVKGRMHVAYVEMVYGDGTILISEMNVQGWNIESQARVPASNYLYIY